MKKYFRVIIYKSPVEWVIKEAPIELQNNIRDVLLKEGYWFVFTETHEHS